MRLKDSRLTSDKYVKLKNKIYRIILSDREHPELDKIPRLYQALSDCKIESVMEIVNDTIEFPYDKELFELLEKNTTMARHDFEKTASNLLGIDSNLVASKLNEYIFYDYGRLLSENQLDNDMINSLSNIYLAEKRGNNQK